MIKLEKQQELKANQPAYKMYIGEFQAAVWEKEVEKDGEKYVQRRFSLQRSYKGRDGKWINETMNVNPNTLPKLQMLVGDAYRYHVMNPPKSQKEKDAEAFL